MGLVEEAPLVYVARILVNGIFTLVVKELTGVGRKLGFDVTGFGSYSVHKALLDTAQRAFTAVSAFCSTASAITTVASFRAAAAAPCSAVSTAAYSSLTPTTSPSGNPYSTYYGGGSASGTRAGSLTLSASYAPMVFLGPSFPMPVDLTTMSNLTDRQIDLILDLTRVTPESAPESWTLVNPAFRRDFGLRPVSWISGGADLSVKLLAGPGATNCIEMSGDNRVVGNSNWSPMMVPAVKRYADSAGLISMSLNPVAWTWVGNSSAISAPVAPFMGGMQSPAFPPAWNIHALISVVSPFHLQEIEYNDSSKVTLNTTMDVPSASTPGQPVAELCLFIGIWTPPRPPNP